jgi:hypothetical protein
MSSESVEAILSNGFGFEGMALPSPNCCWQYCEHTYTTTIICDSVSIKVTESFVISRGTGLCHLSLTALSIFMNRRPGCSLSST